MALPPTAQSACHCRSDSPRSGASTSSRGAVMNARAARGGQARGATENGSTLETPTALAPTCESAPHRAAVEGRPLTAGLFG